MHAHGMKCYYIADANIHNNMYIYHIKCPPSSYTMQRKFLSFFTHFFTGFYLNILFSNLGISGYLSPRKNNLQSVSTQEGFLKFRDCRNIPIFQYIFVRTKIFHIFILTGSYENFKKTELNILHTDFFFNFMATRLYLLQFKR